MDFYPGRHDLPKEEAKGTKTACLMVVGHRSPFVGSFAFFPLKKTLFLPNPNKSGEEGLRENARRFEKLLVSIIDGGHLKDSHRRMNFNRCQVNAPINTFHLVSVQRLYLLKATSFSLA